MLKIAPTLIVEKIEPSLTYFVERLGFEKVAEVPGDGGLDFALLMSGGHEVHLQARASAAKDIPYFAKAGMPPSCFLYFDVADVAKYWELLKGDDVVFPLEKTFYGATHFFIREPGGHILGISQNGTHEV